MDVSRYRSFGKMHGETSCLRLGFWYKNDIFPDDLADDYAVALNVEAEREREVGGHINEITWENDGTRDLIISGIPKIREM